MDYTLITHSASESRTACAIVGVFAKTRKLPPATAALDKASGGLIAGLVRRGDFDGTRGRTLWLHRPANVACERILLVGCGPEKSFDENAFRQVVTESTTAARASGAANAANYLTELDVAGHDETWRLRQAVLATESALYRFERYKTDDDLPRTKLARTAIFAHRNTAHARTAIADAAATAIGRTLTQDLANLPGNVCTPEYLADEARALARRHRLKVEVLDEKAMEKLGMGAFLSVARGSRRPPRLAALHYRGGKTKARKPIVIVGKGITFDTGGISLKPGANMDEMKYDMCGAASVLGLMEAVARLKLPVDVTGVIACAENMPGGNASRPGDIVTTMSGQTVEILNTDAEGRLVLCDTLSWVEKFDPDVVIDMATLTGACIVALGNHASGVMGNHSPLIRALLDAGYEAWDRAWELPLWDDYQEQLKSNFADMGNIGGPPGGTITAGCFLARFTKKYHWAHLDIAGTAWRSGKEKGATGRPVPLLMQYLLHRAGRK